APCGYQERSLFLIGGCQLREKRDEINAAGGLEKSLVCFRCRSLRAIGAAVTLMTGRLLADYVPWSVTCRYYREIVYWPAGAFANVLNPPRGGEMMKTMG